MTLSFVPGEVNKSCYSVAQAKWKNHYIIVYGSGNNLIIYTHTYKNVSEPYGTTNLQTIYLESDARAVTVNESNGLISVALKSKITVLKPSNEYMSRPQWTHALEIRLRDRDTVNCLQWASSESELIAGCDSSLILYYISDQFGTYGFEEKWYMKQANQVIDLHVTDDAGKILTFGKFDRLVKIWSRVNYNTDKTSYELRYLEHPVGTFVTESMLVRCGLGPEKVDSSLLNIKNIRGYLNDHNDMNTIYTISNDHILRVWASYETNGNFKTTLCETFDLKNSFNNDEVGFSILINNQSLRESISPFLTDANTNLFNQKLSEEVLRHADIIIVVSKRLEAKFYLITKENTLPSSSVEFIALNDIPLSFIYDEKLDFADLKNENKDDLEKLSEEEFSERVKPINVVNRLVLESFDRSLHFLIHNRRKNQVLVAKINFRAFAENEISRLSEIVTKFDGHYKSIRKLIKSHCMQGTKEVILSMLNFAAYNYIWEPFPETDSRTDGISLSKEYRLDLCSSSNGMILNAVILSSISIESSVHHLVTTFDNEGYVRLWDCDPRLEQRLAFEIKRMKVTDYNGSVITSNPKAFILANFGKKANTPTSFHVIAIFDTDLIRSWEISINDTKDVNLISLKKQQINKFPQSSKIHLISVMDFFNNQDPQNAVSLIDTEGKLRIYEAFLEERSNLIDWREKCHIHTNIPEASRIHGAMTVNKFAVIDKSGFELTIWDMENRVLEYKETFDKELGSVQDIDWTFVTSKEERLNICSVMSIGFKKVVFLYTQLRYDYTNDVPTFATVKKIDISDYTSHDIGDLLWIDSGHLVIGCGNQLFLDDKYIQLDSASSSPIDTILRELMIGYTNNEKDGNQEHRPSTTDKIKQSFIFNLELIVLALNGPLPVYHPQFLIQALFMGQVELVKIILVGLFHALRKDEDIEWDLGIDLPNEILGVKEVPSRNNLRRKIDKHELFSANYDSLSEISVFTTFDGELLSLLIEKLKTTTLPLLTRHQQGTLLNVVSIVSNMDKSVQQYDENAFRFLIGLKLFQASAKQRQLTIRDCTWALHSKDKEYLFLRVSEYYKNRIKWENVIQTGLAMWMDNDKLPRVIESCARNEFGDTRDPSGLVSLFYLSLRKKQILLGLWRTASHTERDKMLRFLSNDFSEPRWRSAALKNAYVLISKHRYLDAAYFFLLADSLEDCCMVLCRQVKDVWLAIVTCKVYERRSDEEAISKVLRRIIEENLIPDAIEQGDRWLTSWIFRELGDANSSLEALIKSPISLIENRRSIFSERCQRDYIDSISVDSTSSSFLKDDPLLIMLLQSLKTSIENDKKMKGIRPEEEYSIILKVCNLYTRMGCDYLALLLIHDWKFEAIELNGMNGRGIKQNIESLNHTKDLMDTQHNKNVPDESVSLTQRAPPPPSVFEEPDMSNFDFGF